MNRICQYFGLALGFFLSAAVAGGPVPPPAGYLNVSPWGNPAVINFPTQEVGTAGTPQDTTLTAQLVPSTSGYEVRIDSIVVSPGSDFGKGAGCNDATQLADGANCTYPTTFMPTAAGARTAMVNITCSVVSLATITGVVCDGSPKASITLNGSGFVLSQIPTLSQSAITLLALALFGLALLRMRQS